MCPCNPDIARVGNCHMSIELRTFALYADESECEIVTAFFSFLQKTYVLAWEVLVMSSTTTTTTTTGVGS